MNRSKYSKIIRTTLLTQLDIDDRVVDALVTVTASIRYISLLWINAQVRGQSARLGLSDKTLAIVITRDISRLNHLTK